MTLTPNTISIAVDITYLENTENGSKREMMGELDTTLYNVMETGQDADSGDGAFYNDVEFYSGNNNGAEDTYTLDVTFKDGTAKSSKSELADDISDVIYSIFSAGNMNGEGEFYDAVDTFGITISESTVAI